jgi:tetratricopeptide (TPR) repeat protein
MTMRICLAKTIPVLWFSLLALAALTASSSPQAKRAPAKKAPPKAAPAQPTTLAAMVRAYRATPTAPRRAAIEAYAAAHPKEAPFAHLALGIAAYEIKDYAAAIASLRQARPQLAPVADYIAYYLAAARVESKDVNDISEQLRLVYTGEVASPFTGKAWILQARAAKNDAPADAVKLLRDHYAELPQP